MTVCVVTGRLCVVRLPGLPRSPGGTEVWGSGPAGKWGGRGWVEHGEGHEVPQELSSHGHTHGRQRQVGSGCRATQGGIGGRVGMWIGGRVDRWKGGYVGGWICGRVDKWVVR